MTIYRQIMGLPSECVFVIELFNGTMENFYALGEKNIIKWLDELELYIFLRRLCICICVCGYISIYLICICVYLVIESSLSDHCWLRL